MRKDQLHIVYTTIVLSGMMLLFSMIYVSVSTRKLTDSLLQLQDLLKNTSLETLHHSENQDLTEGAGAFPDLRKRKFGISSG